MPLPGKKPPTANPNAAQQAPASASKGKSRLPALPQGGLKAPKAYAYIDLPKDLDRGFYLLRLNSASEFLSTKDNTDKLKLEFTVLDTDVKSVRAGAIVSALSALQGEQSLYFWKEMTPVFVTLSGGEVSDESLTTFAEDREANYTEIVDNGALNGSIARCNLRRATVDKLGADKKPQRDANGDVVKVQRVYRDWEPATEEELTKYAVAVAAE